MPRSIANEAETAKEHREAAKAWPSFIIYPWSNRPIQEEHGGAERRKKRQSN